MTARTGIAAALATVDQEYVAGEAARVVRRHARDQADEQLLLDILGLGDASSEWTTARVVFVALDRCRSGGEFTATTLSLWVPGRAQPLIARALTWMAAEGLAVRTGRAVRSGAPGARGRRIPCWQLTLAGERLSRELSPLPGMTAPLTNLNTMKAS
jgi:hypothetical protein